MEYVNQLAKDAQSSVESLIGSPKLTLYYFDIQGPAEPARLALTIGGIEFTDKRVWFSVETRSRRWRPADATFSTHRSHSTR